MKWKIVERGLISGNQTLILWVKTLERRGVMKFQIYGHVSQKIYGPGRHEFRGGPEICEYVFKQGHGSGCTYMMRKEPFTTINAIEESMYEV